MRKFMHEIMEVGRISHINAHAKVLAYYILLGLFPLVLVLSNIALVWGFSGSDINRTIAALVPEKFAQIIISSLKMVNPSGKFNFSWGNWLSVLLTIWAASRGLAGVRQSLNLVYGVPAVATNWVMRLLAFFSMLALSIIGVILGVAASFGTLIVRWATQAKITLVPQLSHLLSGASWLGVALVGWFALFVLYKTFANAKIHAVSAGVAAFIALTGWSALTGAFTWYLHYFATKTLSYGFFGIVMVFLLWINYLSWVLLFGAVICAVVERRWYGKIVPKRAPLRTSAVKPAKMVLQRANAAPHSKFKLVAPSSDDTKR